MTITQSTTPLHGPGFYITGGKGFHITFANGWTVSVQFGPGNYCDNYDRGIGTEDSASGKDGSSCAEVAAFPAGGGLISLGDDSVRGWQTPEAVVALLAAAANGDLSRGMIPSEERQR